MPGFPFDQGSSRPCACFLVGVEQDGQGPLQPPPAARQIVGQRQHQGGAPSHVKGSGSEDLPVFQPGRTAPGLSHTPNRVQVSQQQQGLPLGIGPRKPGQQVVSRLRVGDHFHRGAVAVEPVGHLSGQPIQRRLVVRRRIGVDQIHQPLDHLRFQFTKIGEECAHGKNVAAGGFRRASWLSGMALPDTVREASKDALQRT